MSEGFLSRWSKRKQEAVREEVRAPGEGGPDVAEARLVPELQAEAELSAIEPAPETVDPDAITPEELASLPPIEEVSDPEGFAPFLRKGVPLLLRNAAMRRMWLLDPGIRDYVDPALDYAYNWNIPGGVPGNGPLEVGFDAKGAAERAFSNLRGRISFETGEWEEQAERDRDTASQVSDDEGHLAEVAASQQVPEDSGSADESSGADAEKAEAEPTTLVVNEDAALQKKKAERQVEQSTPRRHGRALPV
jgi:hypothetical protein